MIAWVVELVITCYIICAGVERCARRLLRPLALVAGLPVDCLLALWPWLLRFVMCSVIINNITIISMIVIIIITNVIIIISSSSSSSSSRIHYVSHMTTCHNIHSLNVVISTRSRASRELPGRAKGGERFPGHPKPWPRTVIQTLPP